MKDWAMKINNKLIYPFQLLILFSFVFAVSYSACTEKEKEEEREEEKDDNLRVYALKEERFDLNEEEYVIMKVVVEEGSDDFSALLRIENHTEKCLMYGYDFSLHYFNNNSWESCFPKGGIEWLLSYLVLSSGEMEEKEDVVWYLKTYNHNRKGKYKLTKEFELISGDCRISGEKIVGFFLSTEFDIK